jgi:hypothetical protein
MNDRTLFLALAMSMAGCATLPPPIDLVANVGKQVHVSTRTPSFLLPAPGGTLMIQSPGTGEWSPGSVQGNAGKVTVGRYAHDFGISYPVRYTVSGKVYELRVVKTAD